MTRRRLEVWAVAAAALFVVATGITGVGHQPPYAGNLDFRFFHAAGVCWLNEQNPYDTGALVAASAATQAEVGQGLLDGSCPFAYPPSAAPFCMAAGALPYHTARVVLLWCSLGCALGLAWMTVRMAAEETGRTALWPAAVVLGLPMTTQVIWLGSSSLIASCLLVAAWRSSRRGSHVAAGVLLGLASIKPQLALLPAVWMLMEGRWRTLLTAGVVTAKLSLFSLEGAPPVETVTTWLEAVRAYPTSLGNQPGYLTVTGLPSLLASAGWEVRTAAFVGLAAAAVAWAWRVRAWLTPSGLFTVLGCAYLGLVYGHDADAVVLAPAAAALAPAVRSGRAGLLAAAGAGILILVPQRFAAPVLRELDLWWLIHWRSLVVCGVGVWVLGAAQRRAILARRALRARGGRETAAREVELTLPESLAGGAPAPAAREPIGAAS